MSACPPCPDDSCSCDRGAHRLGQCSNAHTEHSWGLTSAQQTGSKPQKGKEMARVAAATPPIVRSDDPKNAHIGAAQVVDDLDARELVVCDYLGQRKGTYVTLEDLRDACGRDADRRFRGARTKGMPLEVKFIDGTGWGYRML